MGDYGFRSEVEPRISKSESFILREVIAKSENNLEEAIVYLEEKIEDDSSAALDFALGTMYYQSNRRPALYRLTVKQLKNSLISPSPQKPWTGQR